MGTTLTISDFSEFGVPVRLPQPIWFDVPPAIAEGSFKAAITSSDLADRVAEACGAAADTFPFSTRIFAFPQREDDEVIVRTADRGLPLIVRRDGKLIFTFDLRATQQFHFLDSKRPIYTYLPRFQICMVPERIRRPVSSLVQRIRGPKDRDVSGRYRRLPLTGFEFCLVLLNTIMARGDLERRPQLFHWPSGKRAAFVALHDVDSAGLLQRRERDPLFRIEAEHQIRSTWFVPTGILNGGDHAIDFLLDSGHEVGWHGHKHDHRDHIEPFAGRAVEALRNSRLARTASYPLGMRLPKLLKSNHIFELLQTSCPALCYDTSFLEGVAPRYLWLNGRQSTILEIPCTVPTDIRVLNELHGVPNARKAAAILKAQIERTERLIELGALISIVTHPERTLSERPDLLDVYQQYLAYIRSCPDIWFATAGEFFTYWTGNRARSATEVDASKTEIKIND